MGSKIKVKRCTSQDWVVEKHRKNFQQSGYSGIAEGRDSLGGEINPNGFEITIERCL